jgi:hypothetical protein
MTDAELETDGRFPSGEWTGFFLQRPSTSRQWMQLRLIFRSGTLTGQGSHWVGPFTMDGGYEVDDGRCWWTKRYSARGGFHIWPAGMADPTQSALTRAEEAPAEAAGPRTITRRTFIGR